MMGLVEFLRARLDEDEKAALAVERRHWDVHDTHVSTGGHCASVLSRNPDDQWDVKVVAWLPTFQLVGWNVPGPWANAAHIARHDPARVLREVEAKRRILGDHRLGDADECVICHAGAQSCGCMGWGDFPCDTVRLLAVAYDDHPDYRQEWRP